MSWSFGDETGWMIGAGVFFGIACGIGWAVYQHGQLTMRYILPARTVVLPFIEVMNVQEVPEYKGRWRLVLITDTSGAYESAQASRADVQQAAEWLRRQMQQP